MKYFSNKGLLDLVRLIKNESDTKIDKSVLEKGEEGQFVISDGNGSVKFISVTNSEEEMF